MSIYNYLVALLPVAGIMALVAALHYFPAISSRNRMHPGE